MPAALSFKALTTMMSDVWESHIPYTRFPPAPGSETLEGRVCFSFVEHWCQEQGLEPEHLLEKFVVCMAEEEETLSALLLREIRDR